MYSNINNGNAGKKMMRMENNGILSYLLLLLLIYVTGSNGNQHPLLSFDEIQETYSQDCPYIAKGGKPDPCLDEDCDCFQEDGIGCMFGLCVCLFQAHLVFNRHTKCDSITDLTHYQNITNFELGCPRMCKAADESNTCPLPTRKNSETGRCECPDGTPVVPRFTKHLTLNSTASLQLCGPPMPMSTIPPSVGIEIVKLYQIQMK